MSLSQIMMSFEEAKALLTEPDACLSLVQANKHMTLLPRYIGSFSTGIKQQLNAELKFFSTLLDGVLIAYSNVRRHHSTATIIDHYPHLHMQIQADFIVFKPSVGAVLKGIINKQSYDHIGVLVHNCFNGSVPRPKLAGGKPLAADAFKLGQTVRFTVTHLYTSNRIVSFNGELTEDSLMDITDGKAPAKRTASDVLEEDGNEDSTSQPKKKRKKDKDHDMSDHKKKKKNDNQHETNTSNYVSEKKIKQEQPHESDVSDHKKKKKKDKHHETDTSNNESEKKIKKEQLHESDESSHKRKKKKDKSHENEPDREFLRSPVVQSELQHLASSTPMPVRPNANFKTEDGTSSLRKDKRKHKHRDSDLPIVPLDLSYIEEVKIEKDSGSIGSVDSGLGLANNGDASDMEKYKKKKRKSSAKR